MLLQSADESRHGVGYILLTMLPKEWLLLLVARLVTKTKQKCSCM